ncbi:MULTISPECIES: acyltransferase [unclassified Burkholderia]|uniref:acyltransferase family protein n=1 Tax=unclassified Burkholderia TaxID=2613784 RepID=UPI000F579A68|nr:MULTISPECIES: acyltransferase [unclassified Burkholderia]RQS29394.1 acyltransferase [Burkholderia sp. Bp8995]RQS47640.1 acyltransferase [Burkholderia sp. Bp8989]
MSARDQLTRLDILRGVGALLVVYQHFLDSFLPSFTTSKWPVGASILAEGKIGVSLFCVVSGFIFQYLVRGARVKYWTFIQARCWRIYPLYGLVLLVAAYVLGGDLLNVVEQLVLVIPSAKTGPIFGAVWSIPIEFQFYLAFPFLTLLLEKQGIKQLLLLWGFVLALRAVLWISGWDVNALAYWSIVGRVTQFLAGMIAAKLFYEGRARILGNWWWLAISMVTVCVSTQYFHDIYGSEFPWDQKPMTHWFSVVWPDIQAIAFSGLILSFLQLPGRIPRFIERPLLHIGTVSFSLYLLHRIVEHALVVKMEHQYVHFFGIAKLDAVLTCSFIEVPIAVALATLAYHAIEKPFHQFKKPYLFAAVERNASPMKQAA